jgi:putative ABC transport system ATP-binding protein
MTHAAHDQDDTSAGVRIDEARPSAPGSAAARAVDLRKVYGSGDTQVAALDGVSVEFRKGEFTAIMGPSGSGKSTLMHCLAALDDATSGHVFIGDADLTTLGDKDLTKIRRDRIGFVFQSFNLVPTLTAIENITLPMDIAGRKPDQDWLDTVIGTVGLADRLTHTPSQLTGHRVRRRTNRQPRLRRRVRGARVPGPLGAGVRADGGDGHPRSGGRLLRGPGAVPGRRAHRGRDGRTDR